MFRSGVWSVPASVGVWMTRSPSDGFPSDLLSLSRSFVLFLLAQRQTPISVSWRKEQDIYCRDAEQRRGSSSTVLNE